LLLRAAEHAGGQQQYPKATLYLVATPIGNLADITLRAIHALSLVDAVACEDTRVGARLLSHLGLHKPLLTVHAHNEHEGAQRVIGLLAQGQRVAFISDAGTPAVSDPGAVLVAQATAAGHRVLPLSGPSSALAALCVAGDVQDGGFRMLGFLPAKGQARADALTAALAQPAGSLVLFEAPHRILALGQALAAAAPERTVTICRELTKQFESVKSMKASALPDWLAQDAHHQRGEFVLVIHAAPVLVAVEGALGAPALHALRTLLTELPVKQAVALAAQITGAPRNALYQQALAWRDAELEDGSDDTLSSPAEDPRGKA
jgi:16S rRNA (cytidine1402-2'-O)-methyltransferase